MNTFKKGDRVVLAGVIGTVLHVGKPYMSQRADPVTLDPIGEPYERQDLYVQSRHDKGHLIKQWWGAEQCKAAIAKATQP